MYIQVTFTCGSEKEAGSIARSLVEGKLAACVQVIGPIRSIYQWDNKVEDAAEWLCQAKTVESRFEELEKLIQEEHSYDTPEIIATPIIAGSAKYLDWVKAEVSGE